MSSIERAAVVVEVGLGGKLLGAVERGETQEVMGSEALGTDWRDSVGRLLHRETSSLRAL